MLNLKSKTRMFVLVLTIAPLSAFAADARQDAIDSYVQMAKPPVVTMEQLLNSAKHIEWFVNFSPTEEEAASDVSKRATLDFVKSKLATGELQGSRDKERKPSRTRASTLSDFMQGENVLYGDGDSSNDSSGFSYGF